MEVIGGDQQLEMTLVRWIAAVVGKTLSEWTSTPPRLALKGPQCDIRCPVNSGNRWLTNIAVEPILLYLIAVPRDRFRYKWYGGLSQLSGSEPQGATEAQTTSEVGFRAPYNDLFNRWELERSDITPVLRVPYTRPQFDQTAWNICPLFCTLGHISHERRRSVKFDLVGDEGSNSIRSARTKLGVRTPVAWVTCSRPQEDQMV